MQETTERQQQAQSHARPPEERPARKPPVGDYIDFEEVKD
jgi:hypothetical protein